MLKVISVKSLSLMAWLRRSPRLGLCRLGCLVKLVPCVCADGCCMRVGFGLCVQVCVYGTRLVSA